MQNKSNPHRRRQIGRKVLLADRLARVTQAQKTPRLHERVLYMLSSNPKRTKLATLSVGLVLVAFAIGGPVISGNIATAREAEQQKQYAAQKAKSAAADACRRKKLEQNADLVGKVTYDELYNYDECEK